LQHAVDGVKGHFTKKQIRQLVYLEPAFLAWIRLSPANAAVFLADPARGMEASGAITDPDLLRAIRRKHPAGQPMQAMPNVRIKSVKVE
jgi:hypothetical protein